MSDYNFSKKYCNNLSEDLFLQHLLFAKNLIRVFDERWTGILTNSEDPDEMPRNAAIFFSVSLASRILARPDDNSYVRARALPVCDNGHLVYSGLPQQQY